MNWHETIDTVALKGGCLHGRKVRFFRDGADSLPLKTVCSDLKIDFTCHPVEGEFRIPLSRGSREGIARFDLLHWGGDRCMTLIHHSAGGEINYTGKILSVIPPDIRRKINLFALSAPCSANMDEYLSCVGSLEGLVFLMASSARLMECLCRWIRSRGGERILISGISLGGWIANLHCALYGSADEYRPAFAGTALDHVFCQTPLKQLVSPRVLSRPGVLTEALNFEELFLKAKRESVYPLLAEYDGYVRFGRQSGLYRPENISLIKKGHITGGEDIPALRTHILRGLMPPL